MDARPGGFRPMAVPLVPTVPGTNPAPVGPPGPTAGLDDVDSLLGGLPALAIADQVEIFADIHQRLTAALALTGGQGGVATTDQQRPHQPGR